LCAHEGRIHYDGVQDRNLFVPGDWSIRLCQRCRLAWIDPQPIPEDVALTYGSTYYTHVRQLQPISLGRTPLTKALRGAVLAARYGYSPLSPKLPLAGYLGYLLSLLPLAHRRATLGWFRAVPPYQPNGRLLEIGCGDGNYLSPMRELGWEIHGIEPDPIAAEKVTRTVGAKIWPGNLETAQVPDGHFDAVVALHSIEHVYDPVIFLERAAGFLRRGGFLYIVTPNFDSLTRKTCHRDWLALDVPRHLNLMTPKSLRSICESNSRLRLQSLRTLSRRARREREHVYAVQRTGNFHGEFRPVFAQSAFLTLFSLLERIGNPFFGWGEEIELVASRV
jgi:2-polyprenyl-3-methyl-5-hydroxy-6-metoxy-1,4-benzoquinol methylase